MCTCTENLFYRLIFGNMLSNGNEWGWTMMEYKYKHFECWANNKPFKLCGGRRNRINTLLLITILFQNAASRIAIKLLIKQRKRSDDWIDLSNNELSAVVGFSSVSNRCKIHFEAIKCCTHKGSAIFPLVGSLYIWYIYTYTHTTITHSMPARLAIKLV